MATKFKYKPRGQLHPCYGELAVGAMFRSTSPLNKSSPCLYIKTAQGAVSLVSGSRCDSFEPHTTVVLVDVVIEFTDLLDQI